MKSAILILIPAGILLSGCGITEVQRRELIERAVHQAGILAEQKANEALEKGIKKAVEEARKAGVSEEEIAKLETKLREDGREFVRKAVEEAEKLAVAEADKRLPPAGKGGGWLGDLLLLVAPLALQLAGSYLGKRGGTS